MSIFNRWKRKTLDDATWGRIEYQSAGFWEGEMTLGGSTVEITVDADADGPLSHQRTTAALVAEHFDSLVGKARSFAHIEAEAKVESISFASEEAEWEVVLVTDTDSHYHCVRMRALEAIALRLDG